MDLSELLHNEFIKRQVKNPRYSIRAFAKSLQIEAGALVRIMYKQRIATPTTAKLLLKALDVPPNQHTLILEQLEQTRKIAREQKKKSEIYVFPTKDFEEHMDALHIYVLEALNLRQFQNINRLHAVADALDIPEQKLQEVINQLIVLGAIEVIEEKFKVLFKSFPIVSTVSYTERQRKLLKEFIKKSDEAIDKWSPDKNEYSFHSIPISDADVEKVKAILRRARSRIHAIAEKRAKPTHLYAVSLAMYPLILREPGL
ncbi:DUF4423 domain-containing protein [Bdellovibrio bacteriovorus]|uniref:DUF4423 domain-containing protein n=1 Tax=Bdellovibrio bacteriovorus TaxID=959 RepID=UPI0035A66BB5